MLLAAVLVFMLLLPLLVRGIGVLVRREWAQISEQRLPQGIPAVPIERLAADLRRLRAQLEARENRPGASGKGMKMGAVRLAYLQVLQTACDQLEIEPPRSLGQLQVPLPEIYRVERALRDHGLDVRPAPLPDYRAA